MTTATATATATAPSPTPAVQPHRILLVDDHPMFRLGLRSLLSEETDLSIAGEAEDSESALESLRTGKYDLVILDISLRGANGIDLLKRARGEFPALRALLMSMYEESLYAERALRAGALGYIKKDAPADIVIESVRRALRGELVFSESARDTLLRRLAKASTRADRQDRLDLQRLSDRELEIFSLIGQGLSTRECAERLHVSVKTVEAHQARIKQKLGLKDSSQLRCHAAVWVNQVQSENAS